MAARLLHLFEDIRLLEEVGIDGLHIDIMDGHYVSNLTFGPTLVSQIRKITDLFLDVHLMTRPSKPWLQRFIDAGANRITFHSETEENPTELLSVLKNHNIQSGLAFRPGAAVDFKLLSSVDVALVMSVYPGFSGQKFLTNALSTIPSLKTYPCEICVDGGIDDQTIRLVKDSGAHSVVVGHFLFHSGKSFKECIDMLLNG